MKAALKRKGSNGGYTPAPGGPFSGLVPSMWPQDILAKLAQVRQINYNLEGCHLWIIHLWIFEDQGLQMMVLLWFHIANMFTGLPPMSGFTDVIDVVHIAPTPHPFLYSSEVPV